MATKPLIVRRNYNPDPARCADLLFRLLTKQGVFADDRKPIVGRTITQSQPQCGVNPDTHGYDLATSTARSVARIAAGDEDTADSVEEGGTQLNIHTSVEESIGNVSKTRAGGEVCYPRLGPFGG